MKMINRTKRRIGVLCLSVVFAIAGLSGSAARADTAPSEDSNIIYLETISSGGNHTCGVKTDGTLVCWGFDSFGQTSGPNDNTDTFTQVSAGFGHTCGLKTDGTLECWGDDGFPVDGRVSGPNASTDTFTQVSAGSRHTCGVKTDGALACWGADGEGQVSGPNASSDTFTQVSAGLSHTCGVKTDGTLECWGDSSDSLVSGPNGSSETFTQVSGGSVHTCGLKTDGTLSCWGFDGPGRVSGPNGSTDTFTQVSTGNSHTCGLKTDGALACWGSDSSGQVSGPNASSDTFAQVSAGLDQTCGLKTDGTLMCWGNDFSSRVSGPNASCDVFSRPQISAGGIHTCGLKTDGTLMCWGIDTMGVAGSVSGPNDSTDTFTQVSAGLRHTCGLKTDGTLECWGNNGDGKVSGPNASIDTFTQISAGFFHTCGVKTDGTLACWGLDGFGGPVSGPNLSSETFTQVSAGGSHTCGLKTDGTLACWGSDGGGQISGFGSTDTFTQVSAGFVHTCGLMTDGTLACWGSESSGGRVSGPNASTSTFTQVSAGFVHTCGLMTDGTLECWGLNQGVIGGGSVNGPNASTDTFTQVSVGDSHTCGIKTDGTVECWGIDFVGIGGSVSGPNNDPAALLVLFDSELPTATCNATDLPYVVDEDCETYVQFDGTITDDSCVDIESVVVSVSIQSGGATVTFDQDEDCTIEYGDSGNDVTIVDVSCSIEVSALTECPAILLIELTADDCCGNSLETACSDTATVVDETPPTITHCPEPITLERGSMMCNDDVQNWLDSFAAEDNCASLDAGEDGCELELTNDAPGCGFPFATTATVTFTAEDCCGNTASCSADITIGPAPRVDAGVKGSLLVYSKVDLRWSDDGAGNVNLVQDTILTLTNDAANDVWVKLYFVNGDAALDAIEAGSPPVQIAEAEPGWNWVNCMVPLTKDQPLFWSAWTGGPLDCQPFTALDGGSPAGRPDPENPGGRVLRGFVYAFAVNEAGHEIRWNHLSGDATIVDYSRTSAWEYNAFAFQNRCVEQGEELLDCTLFDDQGVCCEAEVIPGQLAMDAFQLDFAYDQLLLNFFASGSTAFSSGSHSVSLDTDLTLHLVTADLRQDSRGPITTKAHFDIWNQNEHGRSGTTRCITCWDQTLLSQYRNPNNFMLNNLGTDKGKARINGMRSDVCDVNCFADRRLSSDEVGIDDILDLLGIDWVCSYDAALLGLSAKYLSFTGASTGREIAGGNLFGMGAQRAFIKFDIIAPPGELTGENSTEVRGDRGILKTKSIEAGRRGASESGAHLGTTPQR